MVRLNDYAGQWRVVRYYSENKQGVLKADDFMHPYSHIMVERGNRVMVVPRQEVVR